MNRHALAQSGSVESETGKSVAVPAKNGAYEEHPSWKSLRGRMSGGEYLFFNLLIVPIIGFVAPYIAAGIGLFIVVLGIGDVIGTTIGACLLIAVFVWLVYVRIAASVRRFHDFGSSGLWLSVFYIGEVACLFLVILFTTKGNWTLDGVGAAFDGLGLRIRCGLIDVLGLLILTFWPGTRGPNKYGPDPRGRVVTKTGDLASLAQTTKKLQELKKMQTSGLITESEYEQKRSQILSGG